MWDTMLDEFPDCKVILVLRDEEKWITSVQKHLQVEREQFKEMSWWRNWQTLYSFIFNHSSQAMGIYMDWIRPLVIGPESRNMRGENLDVLRRKYRMHNLYVQQHCPKGQLLIYRIGDGWEPLCKFLGKPIPNVPFPHCNRLGSVIADLANDPHYNAMLRKQVASIIARIGIVSYVIYKYSVGAFDEYTTCPWYVGLGLIAMLCIIKLV